MRQNNLGEISSREKFDGVQNPRVLDDSGLVLVVLARAVWNNCEEVVSLRLSHPCRLEDIFFDVIHVFLGSGAFQDAAEIVYPYVE